jgi:hypothetical protein
MVAAAAVMMMVVVVAPAAERLPFRRLQTLVPEPHAHSLP